METNSLQKNILTGWQQVKLGDCMTIKHGKPQKEIEVVGGKYPILATGGVIGRTNTPLYSKPSVLIGRKGTIDKPRYMDTPFWTVDTLFYSQIKENSLPKYLFYKFNTIEWYDYNEASGVPSLTATRISSIKFNLPPLLEQNRIVSVLETWDKSIEKLTLKIEVKKQVKKGLMQDLLTGKKRVRGFSGKWEMVELGDVSKMGSGGTPKSTNESFYGGDIPWVSIADMTAHGKYTYSTFKNLSEEGLNNSSAKIYPKGTILYAMYASIGECSIAGVEMSSSQAILGIIPEKEKLDSMFLYHYLVSIKERIKLQGQQGTQSNLNTGMVKEFVINLPPINEQREIVAIIDTADKEIIELKKKLEILKEQKRYLLNNLITGTIRTPETLSLKVT